MSDERQEIQGIPLPGEPDKAPTPPDFLLSDDWFFEEVEPYRLDFSEPYKPPRFTLSWKGVPFAPLGGIHNITGQSGNGKTMTIAQFIATILCGEFGNLRYELVDDNRPKRVLYIDTEMEKDNTIALKNRVLTMAGRDINGQYDDFVIEMYRDLEEVKALDKDRKPILDKHGRPTYINPAIVRWRKTLKAIWQYKPTVVFIDGVIDVVADFNDNIECQELIFKCMKLASHYDISLWCVLHQNPGGEKLVGHLGSFLERKVTDVIQTKKVKDDKTGDVTFEVKQKKARSQDFADWKFRVLPIEAWGRPEQLEPPQPMERVTGDPIEVVERWFREAKDRVEWPATRKTIKEIIMRDYGKQTNKPKQDIDLQMLINKRLLVESSVKQNGYFLLIPADDELPFEAPSNGEAPY